MSLAGILRGVPLFHELADEDLARIVARARLAEIAPGTVLIEEGSAPTAMFVVVEGELAVTKRGSTGAAMLLNTCGPGDLLGELALADSRPRTASVTARTETRVVVLEVAALHDLLRGSLTATLAILKTIATRFGNTDAVLRQHETLAGLGRIAAGLAHELNNPGAAVKRGAVELDGRLAACDETAFELRAAVDDAQLAAIRALAQPREVPVESAMQRARREQAIEAALEARAVPGAWELAPALAAIGWDAGLIASLELPASAIPAALRWIVASSTARAIARDIRDAASRISELVDAVKSHSHLGEAPVQIVDVHAGIESTLVIFRHKLGKVTVHRQFGELPRIDAYGSELNQVWTNLIDNALHAMDGAGELTIVTRPEHDRIVVEIIDSGHGIPAHLLPEIWKPFFTTKGVGEGTGLGLHLAHNVVVRRHRGTIEVESQPGRTCFRVTLPIHAR